MFNILLLIGSQDWLVVTATSWSLSPEVQGAEKVHPESAHSELFDL